MANLSVYWGTYQPVDIHVKILNDLGSYDPVDISEEEGIEIYLYAKRALKDTDAQAVFTLSTVEGNIIRNDQGADPGGAVAEIYPEDTTGLKPDEKTDLFYDVRMILTEGEVVKPYRVDGGKISILPVVVRELTGG